MMTRMRAAALTIGVAASLAGCSGGSSAPQVVDADPSAPPSNQCAHHPPPAGQPCQLGHPNAGIQFVSVSPANGCGDRGTATPATCQLEIVLESFVRQPTTDLAISISNEDVTSTHQQFTVVVAGRTYSAKGHLVARVPRIAAGARLPIEVRSVVTNPRHVEVIDGKRYHEKVDATNIDVSLRTARDSDFGQGFPSLSTANGYPCISQYSDDEGCS